LPAYEFLIIGLVLLAIGGNSTVRGACRMMRGLGMSPFLTGLLVAPVGLCAPQLFVSLASAVRQWPDLAFGTIIGSNIANALLVAGICAIVRPLAASPKLALRDGGSLLVASIVAAGALAEGISGYAVAAALFVLLVCYIFLAFVTDWRRPTALSISESRGIFFAPDGDADFVLMFLLLIFGLVCLYFGSRYAVDGAVAIGHLLGLSQRVLGLTVMALGSLLPGAAFALSATARREVGIAAGNLIGAGLFNILGVLAINFLVQPSALSAAFVRDVWIMAGSAVLFVLLLAIGWRVTRFQGVVLVACYVAYLFFLVWQAGFLPFGSL